MMITARRVEVGFMAVLALMSVQMAFRPFTLKAFAFPLKLVTVSFAPTPSSSPAYSANLVFTSVASFEMVPAHESVKSAGTGAYTVSDDVAHLSVRLTGLKPDATYAVRCSDEPCSLKKPTVVADWKGRAFWSADRAPLTEADSAAGALVAVAIIDKEGITGSPELSFAVISAGQ